MNLLVTEVKIYYFSQYARKNMDIDIKDIWEIHLFIFLITKDFLYVVLKYEYDTCSGKSRSQTDNRGKYLF
jgi:hypothetical protein